MTPRPPDGSTIAVAATGRDIVIVVPYPSGGLARYGIGLFLLCWLGGWAFGLQSVGTKLLSAQGNLFEVVWLGAWTVGGAFAAHTLFRILRGPQPEIFGLTQNGVQYDSGIPAFEIKPIPRNYAAQWSYYFPKRTRVELDRRKLQSLQLRQNDLGNRLTVDNGATRLDLAQQATEIEREWLYKVLADQYSLKPLPDPATVGRRPAD